VTAATWRWIHLVGASLLLIGWTIYLVRLRGHADSSSLWFPALLLGNGALGIGRLYVDRRERQRVEPEAPSR
jgi:hypothetical protein